MTLGRFQKKVQLYQEFAGMGYYQQRFGVKFLRVLVITLTRRRLLNLKDEVEAVGGKEFWFTTIDQITPNTVFGNIWRRAGSHDFYPLVRV